MKSLARALLLSVLALAATPAVADDFVNLPVVVNILKGAGFTDDDVKAVVERANEIYKQAKIKLTLSKTNKDVEIGDKDADLTKEEGDDAKKKGDEELKNATKGKGVKIYLTNKPWSEEPDTNGWAVHKNPVVFIRKNPSGADDAEKLKRTGNTAAHEIGHVLTLPDRYNDAAKDNLMYGYDSRTDTKLTEDDIKEIVGEAKKRAKVQEKADAAAPSEPKSKESAIGVHTEATQPSAPEFLNVHMSTISADAAAPDYQFRLTLGNVLPPSAPAQFSLLINTDSDPLTGQVVGDAMGVDLAIQVQAAGGNPLVNGLARRLSGPPMEIPFTGTLIDEVKFEDPDELALPSGAPPPVHLPYQSVIDFSLPKPVLNLSGSDLFEVVVTSGDPLAPLDQFVMQLDRQDHLRGPQLSSPVGQIDVTAAGALLPMQGAQFLPSEMVDIFLDDLLLVSAEADPVGGLNLALPLPSGLAADTFYFITGQGRTSGDFGFFVVDAIGGTLAADFDDDGDVDKDDLLRWQTAFGSDGGADADGDGDSDGADFLVWQQQFSGGAVPPAAVPEPGSSLLWLAAVLAEIGRRRIRAGRRELRMRGPTASD